MEKIVGLIDMGRLIGFWLRLGSECDLWDIMNWKRKHYRTCNLKKYLKQHHMPELISVKMYYFVSYSYK